MPLFWTVPLGIYLITTSWRLLRTIGLVDGCGRSGSSALLWHPLSWCWGRGCQLFWIPLHLLAFFAGAMACHGRLAAMRSGAAHATAFYLAIALGGVLGGLFNSLLAPLLFDRLIEYPLVIILACLAAPGLVGPSKRRRPGSRLADYCSVDRAPCRAGLVAGPERVLDSVPGVVAMMTASGLGLFACVTGLRRPIRFALTAGGFLLASGLAQSRRSRDSTVERDFFGTIKVLHDPLANVNRLLHGSTLHGQQSLDHGRRGEPSTYFARPDRSARSSRPGTEATKGPGQRVGIIGLGTATLACYARPGQSWTFYEIDPAVMPDCPGPAVLHVSSRLSGSRRRSRDHSRRCPTAAPPRPEHGYQLIVVDVFSSDVLPVHLLSREAFRLYELKLAEGGLLAINLSSRYLDLDPVMAAGRGRGYGLPHRARRPLD